MAGKARTPVHPGEILLNEFMYPYELSCDDVAEGINVPTQRIGHLIDGNGSVTADLAVRLERFFGMSAMAWLNLQRRYDLEVAKTNAESDKSVRSIKRFKPPGTTTCTGD